MKVSRQLTLAVACFTLLGATATSVAATEGDGIGLLMKASLPPLSKAWPRTPIRRAPLSRAPARSVNVASPSRANVSETDSPGFTPMCDTGGLEGWLEGRLAIDVTRALRLRSAGYRTHTATIPDSITPQNRLLIGEPAGGPAI